MKSLKAIVSVAAALYVIAYVYLSAIAKRILFPREVFNGITFFFSRLFPPGTGS